MTTSRELTAKAENLEHGLNRLKGALEHAIAMMETAIDRGYDDPAKLFDLDHYRDIIASVEDSLR